MQRDGIQTVNSKGLKAGTGAKAWNITVSFKITETEQYYN